MFTIEYTYDGTAYKDWHMEFIAENINATLARKLDEQHYAMTWKVSTENVLFEVRACIKEGKLPYDKIQFKYEDNIIAITKDGRCDHHVDGFHDLLSKQLDRLIDV